MRKLCLIVAYVATFASLVSAETLATVTKKAYLNFTIDGEPIGRVVIGLFGDVAPKAVANFA